jgi:transposase
VRVFSGSSTKAEARAVAQLIARQISPIELTADRLEHTERYTQTLFVQIEESTAARRVFEIARGILRNRTTS